MAMLTRLALGLATGLVVGVAPHEASARATTIARNGTGKRVLRITTLATFRATGPGGGGPHRQTDRTFAGRIDGRQQRWTVFRWPVRAACSCTVHDRRGLPAPVWSEADGSCQFSEAK